MNMIEILLTSMCDIPELNNDEKLTLRHFLIYGSILLPTDYYIFKSGELVNKVT